MVVDRWRFSHFCTYYAHEYCNFYIDFYDSEGIFHQAEFTVDKVDYDKYYTEDRSWKTTELPEGLELVGV